MNAHLLAAAKSFNCIVQLPEIDFLAIYTALALLLKGGFEVPPGQTPNHVMLRRHSWQVQFAILPGHDTCMQGKHDWIMIDE